MGDLINRVLNYAKDRRQKIINGGINTIPSPFKRFSEDFIGVEQGKFYIVTGQTKSGKSQLANYVFVYNTLIYAFNNPDRLRLKIFYFPLEETPENIMFKFMSYYLYIKTNKKIQVSPTDLMSSKSDNPISQEILDILNSEEYITMFNFFEEHVQFSPTKNPTGIYKEVKSFMEDNGTVFKKEIKYKDEFGVSVTDEGFDHYEPNDPDLYTIVLIDHIGLIQQEKFYDSNQLMTLKQSMDKISEYCKILRNKYNVTPVIVQQQSVESESNDSIKLGRVRPTYGNLADTKYTARDADIMIGIFSPHRFELPDYKGYNITILKDNFRLIELIINRAGSPGGTIGLYFNGMCNYFKELPLPKDPEMSKWYNYIKGQNLHNTFLILHKKREKKQPTTKRSMLQICLNHFINLLK